MRALRVHAGAWALCCSAIVAGVALAALAAAHDRLPGDLPATLAVQRWPFPGETLADALRALTATEVVLGLGTVLAGAAWLAGRRRQARVFGAGLVLVVLLQFSLKELVDRPRPAPDLVEVCAGFTSASFPAGHAMSATYLYGFLAVVALAASFPAPARAALAGLVALFLALAGLANVSLGVHWPSDVVGGYVWALAVLVPAARAAFPNRPYAALA